MMISRFSLFSRLKIFLANRSSQVVDILDVATYLNFSDSKSYIFISWLPRPAPETLMSPRHNSVVTPSHVKKLFKPRNPFRLCGFHPIKLSSFITTPHWTPISHRHPDGILTEGPQGYFEELYPQIPPRLYVLPVVCWDASRQGLWPPWYPLTPTLTPATLGAPH